MIKLNGSRTTAVAAAAILAAGCLATPAAAESGAGVYLAATLLGSNEVGKGDNDGGAVAIFHITGNKIEYAIQWKGIATPTAFHIHQGKAGKNGDVKVPFFGEKLPGSLSAVIGVARADSGLLNSIKNKPKNWYTNLHTGDFPDGAVRGQLMKGGW
ncbi:CHRD domain-containing protein [Nonomuraea basaltis]|uniref:CHRD domain-containing protein n=1 Tax=Nonomuraea basaltis TaxID=2495887 RepID=UPI00110C5A48|nr:CHRD domain-containing protein [Nonomuraea basaltis]TMR97161.1 CHRD domain-containing protein [Nonomuraea basaltis]